MGIVESGIFEYDDVPRWA